jgi:hypothetical protein
MDEPVEQTHIFHATPHNARAHWPGRCCVCAPEVLELDGPCGHPVLVVIHAQFTTAQKEQLVDNIRAQLQRRH